ncbi:hypothetical protein M0R45_033574 [Rubus argutus]|uniref:Uncharacterized protein n=1 Tax=Rubus argutus TaxID=59490 RepID=A0AAW1WPN1_RUBAR
MWAILQTHVMKTYPDKLVLAFLYNLSGTIILATTRFIYHCLLLYTCILVHIWGQHLKGPVYISSFKPLSIAIAAASGVIFLGDDLYPDSVVGARGLPIGNTPLLESYKVENM